MRTQQRETVFMLLDLLRVPVPTVDRMAILAIRPELPSVNIRVAIGAVHSYFFEFKVGVTLGTGHLGVHPTQGIASLVVIELRHAANRFPA